MKNATKIQFCMRDKVEHGLGVGNLQLQTKRHKPKCEWESAAASSQISIRVGVLVTNILLFKSIDSVFAQILEQKQLSTVSCMTSHLKPETIIVS